jgi:large subunit ribosomal protein L10
MPKTLQQKKEIVAEFVDRIKENESLFVVAPDRVDPNEAAELKIKLHEIGGNYNLVKNSLFTRALEEAGLDVPESFSSGQNAVIFAGENAPEAAKIMKEFIKETEKAEFKEGYLEHKLISAEKVNALAELPSREVLLAQVLAQMNAPVSGFVNVLAGNIRNIVTVIDNIRDQKAKAGA